MGMGYSEETGSRVQAEKFIFIKRRDDNFWRERNPANMDPIII